MECIKKPVIFANCGLFGISDDYIEKYQSLDQRFIRNKSSTFFFEATGDSMEPIIHSGDVLIVDRSLSWTHGNIIVGHLDGQFICKRLLKSPDGLILRSENKLHRDILITEEIDFLIWGVVSGLGRDLRNF
ncbi:LexA family transcriptional regulator [Bacteriovorax sp. Seq25_V]|uniref:LexA family protein n=1 Tax=Bacteriovorax sp. Seq25_V TaxID=1201288 RepID=UPI000389DF85|nr:S24 family peptidase [Bacteriovorax sp. Seq25_V]EQC47329.1 UmuD family protein [Bacteriovorax sp. Seq25_V]